MTDVLPGQSPSDPPGGHGSFLAMSPTRVFRGAVSDRFIVEKYMDTSSSTSPSGQADGAPRHVNMMELAAALQLSRQTVAAWVTKWPDFPVVSRGATGRAYVFDVAAVVAFLQTKRQAEADGVAARDSELAQLVLPLLPQAEPDLKPGLTVKERIEAVRLQRMLREEAERTRQLVAIEPLRQALGEMLAALSRNLDALARQLASDGVLSGDGLRVVEARVRGMKAAILRDVRQALQGNDAEAQDDVA